MLPEGSTSRAIVQPHLSRTPSHTTDIQEFREAKTPDRGDSSTNATTGANEQVRASEAEPVLELESPRKETGLTALRHKLNPALKLQNTGSVARDHLASERTFLAYVRTSLAIASTGVGTSCKRLPSAVLIPICRASALVQLFTIAGSSNQALQKYARPLGATIIIIGLCTLVLGVTRYYSVQASLVRGMYPVARMSAVLVAIALSAVIIAVFAILLANRT